TASVGYAQPVAREPAVSDDVPEDLVKRCRLAHPSDPGRPRCDRCPVHTKRVRDTRQDAGSQRPTYGVRSERIAEVTGGHRHTARQLLVRPAGAAICGMQQPPIGIVELNDVIFKLEYRLVRPTDVKRLVQWQPISRSQCGGLDDLVSCP